MKNKKLLFVILSIVLLIALLGFLYFLIESANYTICSQADFDYFKENNCIRFWVK